MQHPDSTHQLIHYVQKKYFGNIFFFVWISLHPENSKENKCKAKAVLSTKLTIKSRNKNEVVSPI